MRIASVLSVTLAVVCWATGLLGAASAVNVSKSSGKSTSPALAAYGPLLLAAWEDTTPGNPEIVMATSADGGATFGTWQNISQTPGESTCFDWTQQGEHYYFVWSDNTPGNKDVFYRRLDVIPPIGSVFANLSASAADSVCPKIAVTGGNVYVAWTENGSVKFRRSTDGGATFKPVITLGCSPLVSDIAAAGPNVSVLTNRAGRSTSASSGAGFVTSGPGCGPVNVGDVEWGYVFAADPFFYYLFRVKPAPGNQANIYFRREGPVNIPNTLVCHQHEMGTDRAGIIASGRSIYAWWDWAASGPGLLFTRSADGGLTWSGAADVTGGSFLNPGRQRAVLAGKNLYFVWEAMGGTNDIWFRRSTDAGASFGPVANVSNNSTNSSTPAVLVNGLTAYVGWEDAGMGGNKDIFLNRSATGSFSVVPDGAPPVRSSGCGG